MVKKQDLLVERITVLKLLEFYSKWKIKTESDRHDFNKAIDVLLDELLKIDNLLSEIE